MRDGAGKDARQPQLREQPIETVRPLGHVFEKQHAARRRVERVRRAERGRNLGQRAAEDRAGRFAGHDRLELWREQLARGLGSVTARTNESRS